ncbi:MAG: DUF1492 domain-containing protein [Deltaproteobacteria bacterium]|jgi:predicted DNA-binding protein YlxM (UPF0122 family)|nr:DUF1492 domain-containing protein [Deltaproteobacteria bacterium]
MANSIDKKHPVICNYFSLNKISSTQKKYLVSRYYYYDKMQPIDICNIFNISKTTFYKIINKFIQDLENNIEPFFAKSVLGRRPINRKDVAQKIIDYRKQNLSVPQIKVQLDAEAINNIDTKTIFSILEKNGFSKMPRRDYEPGSR